MTIVDHEELQREQQRVDTLLGHLENCRRQANYLFDEDRRKAVKSSISDAINELNSEAREIARDLEKYRQRH